MVLEDLEVEADMPTDVLEFYNLDRQATSTFDPAEIFDKDHLPKFERGEIILKFCVFEKVPYFDVDLASTRARILAQRLFTRVDDVIVEGLVENAVMMAMVDSGSDTEENDP